MNQLTDRASWPRGFYNAHRRHMLGSPSAPQADSMLRGLIQLLYKKGREDLLANYRPTTLVNKTQSTLALAVHNRWMPLMPLVTSSDQCASVPGRYMEDCLLKFLDALDWARHMRTNLVALLLDARKAFDLLDREYLKLVSDLDASKHSEPLEASEILQPGPLAFQQPALAAAPLRPFGCHILSSYSHL